MVAHAIRSELTPLVGLNDGAIDRAVHIAGGLDRLHSAKRVSLLQGGASPLYLTQEKFCYSNFLYDPCVLAERNGD